MHSLVRLFALLLAVSLLSGVCFAGDTSGPGPGTVSGELASNASFTNSSFEITIPSGETTIPGPLRSFLRMAGISQKASPEEVLPLLAGQMRLRGYAHGRPTEYLVLLRRYLHQARELSTLAGSSGVLHVSNCDDAKPLLTAIGYRLHQPCGPQTAVQTDDPELAFLTIDSGFPLAQLEQALRQGKAFDLPYSSSPVPMLFTRTDWTSATKSGVATDVLESLLGDPALARLYSALARMDRETATSLRQSMGLKRLVRFGGVLDFYGSNIYIRSGRVVVPGGTTAEPAWKDMVGADPGAPQEFIPRLLAKDEGWLAAYFDSLSRTSQSQQSYFTEHRRLKAFYEALRGQDLFPSPTRPIFRPQPNLALLVTRLPVNSAGQPDVPGGLEVWKTVFRRRGETRRGRDWARRAEKWNTPDQLVEGLFASSREYAPEGPLPLYLTLSEIDRGRSAAEVLTPETTGLLAERFSRFGDQYSVFAEFHSLTNNSVVLYLKVAEKLDHISAPGLRANAIGIFQADIGLWQILARQRQIPNEKLNSSWQHLVSSFEAIESAGQLFDSGRSALAELCVAAGDKTATQDGIVALLAGPEQQTPEGRQVRQYLAEKISSVLEAQRLASLDSLFTLGEGLNEMIKGNAKAGEGLIPLAAELHEFEMPRPIFTSSERIEFTHIHADIGHTTLQARTNLAKMIRSGTQKELTEARGRLAPFLRDTLVGLNYAYYEPPGAQMLHNNAIFVRSHDYSEEWGRDDHPWKVPQLVNRGITASGGTHLAGSLADLPYVLAVVEQDFIVPDAVQSLIWEDLAPTLLTDSVVPRWWNVTQNELHAVALYQRAGDELLGAATGNDDLRQKLMTVLSDRLLPITADRVEKALRAGQTETALSQIAPGDSFYVTAEFQRKFPGETARWSPAGKELDALAALYPQEVSLARMSQDFGGPHPALTHSNGSELLNLKPFPAFQIYSSRLLAEAWDSNNLYWARLADELNYQPVMLNRLAPELTRRMMERLFASNLEDWPAILRAMRETGEEFRAGKIATVPKSAAAAGR